MSRSEYKQFVSSIRNEWSNGAAFAGCGCEVPRNTNGWPTIEPQAMDDLQLLYEASRWAGAAQDAMNSRTVSGMQWTMYADELIHRGLMDEDCKMRIDLFKILTKGWKDLPPGPIIVDPNIPDPVSFDPSKDRSWFRRATNAIIRAVKRTFLKP